MTKAKSKFNEYVKNNKIEKIIVTKDAVVCLPSGKFARQIAKEQRKGISGVIDKIKYAPMVLSGADIEKTDFYCGGNYDNNYSSVAKVDYLSVIDEPDAIIDANKKHSIFICAKSPEKLKSVADTILDILDEVGTETYFTNNDGHKSCASEILVDVSVGDGQIRTPREIGRSAFLSHSRDAFDAIVNAIVDHNSESEM